MTLLEILDITKEFLLDKYDLSLSLVSTYNLGIAISAFAIVVAFIELTSKGALKIRIHNNKKRIALYIGFSSIILCFFAEFFKFSFILNILGAILMISSISLFVWLIVPIRKIDEEEAKKIKKFLDGFLPNTYAHENSEIIKDIIYVFDSLLTLSLENKEIAELFNRYFTSKVFLNYFSQSGYIFSKTLNFLLKNNQVREVRYFFNQLFLTSLNNQNSYLNIFISEDIYPNTNDDFDMALLENGNINILLNDRLLFYRLNSDGKLSFLKIIKRYFNLINNYNECKKYPPKKDCKIIYQLNDNLVNFFFESIEGILGSFYRASEQEKKDILEMIRSVLRNYNYCIDFNQKSEVVRKRAGKLLYKIYEEMLMSFDLNDKKEDDFEIRHSVREFYTDITSRGEDKISQKEFLEKLKDKIIKEDFGCNIKGWYPAMILIYWQLFGFSIFSGNNAMNEPKEIHIEILSELSKSFPKLYDGHIRNFYDNPNLPEGKEELLKKQGRKILDDFLLSYMGYDRDENSLSYYYGFGESINGGKIFLDKVASDNKIEVTDI